MPWFDTHAHLDSDDFRNDLPAVLARAAAAGVTEILSVGTSAASSAAVLELARGSGPVRIRVAAGVHPNYIPEAAPGDWERIEALAALPEVAAIGETGLDKHWDTTPFPLQIEWFDRHIELSRRLRKPFIVHCRECEPDVLDRLRGAYRRQGSLQGVLHSWCGSWEGARECLDMGLFVSFAGMATYKNAESVRQVAAKVPLDRLLLETDSPYLAPVPHRGKRNEPAYVAKTGLVLAELRGETAENFGRRTTENAYRWLGVAP